MLNVCIRRALISKKEEKMFDGNFLTFHKMNPRQFKIII